MSQRPMAVRLPAPWIQQFEAAQKAGAQIHALSNSMCGSVDCEACSQRPPTNVDRQRSVAPTVRSILGAAISMLRWLARGGGQ